MPTAAPGRVIAGSSRRGAIDIVGVALVRQALHGRRQRLAVRRDGVGLAALLELGDELEDPGAALRGVIEADVELRDALQPETMAQLAPDEAHGLLEGA